MTANDVTYTLLFLRVGNQKRDRNLLSLSVRVVVEVPEESLRFFVEETGVLYDHDDAASFLLRASVGDGLSQDHDEEVVGLVGPRQRLEDAVRFTVEEHVRGLHGHVGVDVQGDGSHLG